MNLGPHADFIIAAYAVTAVRGRRTDRLGRCSTIRRSGAFWAISTTAASHGARSERPDHEHRLERGLRQKTA